jgi:hypothetical protein
LRPASVVGEDYKLPAGSNEGCVGEREERVQRSFDETKTSPGDDERRIMKGKEAASLTGDCGEMSCKAEGAVPYNLGTK